MQFTCWEHDVWGTCRGRSGWILWPCQSQGHGSCSSPDQRLHSSVLRALGEALPECRLIRVDTHSLAKLIPEGFYKSSDMVHSEAAPPICSDAGPRKCRRWRGMKERLMAMSAYARPRQENKWEFQRPKKQLWSLSHSPALHSWRECV